MVVSVRLAIAASSSFSWGKRRIPIVAIKTTLLSQIVREQIRNYINTHGELAGEKEIYYEYQSNESIDDQAYDGK